MAGDEDKTPEAAFKNVPRRKRSASSGSGSGARPRKEELGDGGGPGRGGSSASPPPAPCREDDGPAVAPSAEEPEDAKNGGGDAPPAPSRMDEAASASSSRKLPVNWAEKERIRKGKMPAANESPPRRSAYDDDNACSGGGDKLMGDAIRSHGGTAAACFKMKQRRPSKSKKRKDRGPPFWYGMGRDGQSTSTAGSDVDYSFDKIGVVSDGLRAALGGLGLGAAPQRVYGRMMSRCDRNTHQARLQMSCKSWRVEHGEYPLCAFLTEAEKKAARGKGLAMEAYDRRGELYKLNCKYLGCNKSYRLISKWGDFLRNNDLVVKDVSKTKPGAKDVMLDLWLYRPPGGEVGMVMLHYRKGDAAHADAAFEEEDRRTRTRSQDDATAAAAPPSPPEPDGGTGGNNDAVMEDVAGDANEKGQDDAGVKGEAAAAPSPSEPDGGAKAAGEEQAGGALSEAAAATLSPYADGTKTEEKEAGGTPMEVAALSLSSEAGVAANKEAGAPPGEADGTKTDEKEASAPTKAAAESSSSDAGGAAKAMDKLEAGAQGKEAAPPSPSPDAGGDKKDAGGAALSVRFGLTPYELLAAHTLVMLSQGWL